MIHAYDSSFFVLFCLHSTVMNVHHPITEGSCPLFKVNDDNFLSTIIDDLPGLKV